MRSAAVGGGGAGLRPPPSGLGWAGLLQCVRACDLVSAGGNSSRGLHSRAGRVGPGVSGGLCGGGVRVTGPAGVLWGVGLPAAGACGLPGVGGGEGCSAGASVAGVCGCLGGWGRPVSRGPGLHTMVGMCGPPGGKWGGRGRGWGCVGGCGAGVVCVLSVYVSACSGAAVWSLVGQAVWRRSLPSSAATARISQMSVRIWCTSWSVVGRGYCSAGLRSMRRWTLWMAWYPQVRGCCGRGGGGLSACLGLPRLVCGRWVWPRSRARSPWTASGA